ncbi:protein piccolo [Pungitius pungitius]|uniref:protein piccolo n=1 Tax=Pungitius pungitius TaxID=134920 RepID=UPI002E1350BD
METEYSNLRRPKRKLCYLTNKTSPPKKWTDPLTLEDVDKIFDDLDSPSHVKDDLLPSSSLLPTFDTEPNQCGRQVSPLPQDGHLTEQLQRCQMGLKGDSFHPASAPGPKPVIDLDVPFKAHMPVKTSSPIEEKMVVVEELDNEKHHVVSPILFACGDEGEEEAKTEPLLLQEPQCNGHGTEEYLDYVLESPPSKVVFNKPKIPCHQNKAAGLGTETLTVKEKILKKPPASDLEGQRKRRQESTDPRVSAVRQEPELAAPKKPSEIDMTTFLKKLRDAVQPKPACSRMTPVKVPTLSAELEEDFLILEDEKPLWFSIPTKTATRKKQRQGRTSSSDKDSSTDKSKKESSLETAQKRQESEQTKDTLGSQSVHQKTKKSKGGGTKNKIAEPGSDKDGLSGLEELPADDLMFEEQPKEKQGIKNASSKGEEEEQPKDGAGGETNKEIAPLKTEKKAQKSSDMKRPKSSKCKSENAKTSRAKSLKGGRRVTHGSDAVKETMTAQKEQSWSSEEHAEAEDLSSPPDEEGNSEAQTEKDVADEKDKINKLPVASKETSSEAEDVINWKRKRRPVGQWWATQPITEEAKLTDSQPTVKKSKQHNQEPVKTKKDRVLQKKKQIQPSRPNPNKSKGRKTKQSKIKNTREDSRPDKEPQHQDQDALSSPLDLSHRDHSSNLGNQVFQKVYHNSLTEKVCTTAASVSPRGRREELRAAESERRRRKPPGSWWQVGDMCEEAEGVSPRQQRAGPAKDRKKVSKPRPGTPKNGKAAASPKPRGGAAAPLLATPKTAGPLATVKGFDAAAPGSGAGRRRSGRGAAAPPAQDAAVCTVFSDGDLLGLDAVEPQDSHDRSANNEAPQDSNFQSENQLKFLRSGPSSMIGLREYEEDEDNLIFMADRSPAALSLSDLCAPPLKPLILQPKDKANLTEWFRSLWSVPADKGGEVSPDQFEWYFYQGRAIGFVLDLNCGSFCNGKILLGSYMKKPLWVDHSATTVFNLLTSSVSVTIDGKESCFHPGQSLMVPCGHAYSIQNVTAQPAVLYFTRILAESSD